MEHKIQRLRNDHDGGRKVFFRRPSNDTNGNTGPEICPDKRSTSSGQQQANGRAQRRLSGAHGDRHATSCCWRRWPGRRAGVITTLGAPRPLRALTKRIVLPRKKAKKVDREDVGSEKARAKESAIEITTDRPGFCYSCTASPIKPAFDAVNRSSGEFQRPETCSDAPLE